MRTQNFKYARSQQGAAVIEFALVAVIFFTLILGIMEFARLFFSINSAQEITRRAAREQVVRWTSESSTVQREAVLRPGSSGVVTFPGVGDINNTKVLLSFHGTYADAMNNESPISYGGSSDPTTNFNNCLLNQPTCIRFVRAALSETDDSRVFFDVLVPFIPADSFALPYSTVIMPAEALGLL